MDCNWTALLKVLPLWLRDYFATSKKEHLQEIRLRIGMQPILVYAHTSTRVQRTVHREDLEFCINAASRYSPWTSQTIAKGYVTVHGGHRIGICGTVAMDGENIVSVRDVSSLCIRVARQFLGIGEPVLGITGNILILGAPGSGKSTLLRDVIRCKSQRGISVCVVDERQELFPCVCGSPCFECGTNTDIISGCPKAAGIDMAIRLMSPGIIAVDEITAKTDCDALMNAGWCGVSIIATAHASSKYDFIQRPIYKSLVDSRLFDTLLILQRDKSWRTERMQYGN